MEYTDDEILKAFMPYFRGYLRMEYITDRDIVVAARLALQHLAEASR